jgi:uncharacterized protein (DUF488 family)
MAATRVFTIGVYGFDRETFFASLEDAGIDAFIDVRRRRAARGSRYAFANKNRLVAELTRRGIPYRHELGLAPENATRAVQYAIDAEQGVSQSQRTALAPAYIDRYVRESLDTFDFETLAHELRDANAPVIFCLERLPAACHRSLVAPRLAVALGLPPDDVVHLLAAP